MSGTIKTDTLKLNGVDKDYFFPDPVGDVVEVASEMEVDGVPTSYFKGPAIGNIDGSLTLNLNGVPTSYYRPNTTGFGSSSGVTTRNFTELSSAGMQRFTTPSITLASDWEIEIDFQDSGGAFATILGSQVSNNDLQITQVSWGAVGGRSNIAVYLSGANEYWPVSSHTTAGVLHTVKVTLTGSTVELFIDGLSLGTKIMTPFTDPFSFLIGANSSLSWLSNGYLANFKLTDNGTLVRSYAIDEDWSGGSTVLVDSVSGQNGTAVNITDADAENFTLDDTVSPNTWTNDGATVVINIAGT